MKEQRIILIGLTAEDIERILQWFTVADHWNETDAEGVVLKESLVARLES